MGRPDPSRELFAEKLGRSDPSRKLGSVIFHLMAVNSDKRHAMKFIRITVDPAQMGGVPCIRGLRIPVATVVGMAADGMTTDEILRAYPELVPEDIREALRYAAETVREREMVKKGSEEGFPAQRTMSVSTDSGRMRVALG